MPWLLLAEPWDGALGATRALRFSDVGFTSEPGDVPGNTYWDRRIEVPLVVRQSLFSGAAASGRSEISIGAVTLANGDGALDALADYDWDGRLVELRYSQLPRPTLADFAVVFSGAAERIVPGDTISIEARDLQLLLDEPFQPERFAGTGGAEGPPEYRDRRKPFALGIVRQAEPVPLDGALLIYAYGSGPCGQVLSAEDRGVALAFAANHPTYGDLAAATVPAGSYATCRALGLIRYGARGGDSIFTVSVEGAAPAGTALTRFADIAQHVIDRATALGPADFAAGTVAALNALAPQPLGHWYDGSQEATVRQVLDTLADAVGAFYGFDDARRIVMGRFDAPSSTAAFVFSSRDLIALEPLPAERRLRAQVIGYGRRWRPLAEADIAGGITGDARTAFRTAWQQERHADAAVGTASLLAREERADTALDSQADALAEAQRRVALFGPLRSAFRAVVEYLPGVRPGMTIELRDPRFGLATGRRFRVMRLERNAAELTVAMELWG